MSDFVLENVSDFHLKDTLECGQCFRFDRLAEDEYVIVAKGVLLHIEEERLSAFRSNIIFHDTDEDTYIRLWRDYFDLDTDYSAVKARITEADPRIAGVIRDNPGIRILRQEFFETLISFIISQNKQIPQIKQVVRNVSEMFGSMVEVPKSLCAAFGGTSEVTEAIADRVCRYAFPTAEQLSHATDADLRDCKAGFRAPYILDAVEKVRSGVVAETELRRLDTADMRTLLMSIKGVGEKVASCVMLYGLSVYSAFPVDVWMKRICTEMYYDGRDVPKDKIEADMCERFGAVAGFAQQYLFMYAREHGGKCFRRGTT